MHVLIEVAVLLIVVEKHVLQAVQVYIEII